MYTSGQIPAAVREVADFFGETRWLGEAWFNLDGVESPIAIKVSANTIDSIFLSVSVLIRASISLQALFLRYYLTLLIGGISFIQRYYLAAGVMHRFIPS